MPVPLRPEVTKSTCLMPIAAASAPACWYAPAPNNERGCLKNSFTGNSNIREVSIEVTSPPFLYVKIQKPTASVTASSQRPIDHPFLPNPVIAENNTTSQIYGKPRRKWYAASVST